MRFSEIRKTGKKVLVNNSRRHLIGIADEYGLETFKQISAQHWVEGVVVERVKEKQGGHIIVVINKYLLSEINSYQGEDPASVYKFFDKDIDYKRIGFRRGEEIDCILKEGSDIYSSGVDDEKIKTAIENDKGVKNLIRKPTEDWTDADLQSFYFYFLVPNFGYRTHLYTWVIGTACAEAVRHARQLYGIYDYLHSTLWRETFEEYRYRSDKEFALYSPCFELERRIAKGFFEGESEEKLKRMFDEMCALRGAHQGISVEQILERRNRRASSVSFGGQSFHIESKEKALEKFLESYAANPDEETRKKFVIYKKMWE